MFQPAGLFCIPRRLPPILPELFPLSIWSIKLKFEPKWMAVRGD